MPGSSRYVGYVVALASPNHRICFRFAGIFRRLSAPALDHSESRDRTCDLRMCTSDELPLLYLAHKEGDISASPSPITRHCIDYVSSCPRGSIALCYLSGQCAQCSWITCGKLGIKRLHKDGLGIAQRPRSIHLQRLVFRGRKRHALP